MDHLKNLRRTSLSRRNPAKQDLKKSTVRRRSLRVEALEARQLFAIAPFAPLGNKSTMLVPGFESPVHFTVDTANTTSKNTLGYFYVDGADGRLTQRQSPDIDSPPLLDSKGSPRFLLPGDAG